MRHIWFGRLLILSALMILSALLGLFQYVGSEEGREQLPLLLLILVGLPSVTILTWIAYKIWYRRHYGP